MKLQIEQIQFHLNAACGAPFYAVTFCDPSVGRMLGIVFEEQFHVAVLNLDTIASENVGVANNSLLAPEYESFLRGAIALIEEMDGSPGGAQCQRLTLSRKCARVDS